MSRLREILASGLPCCVIRYHITELVTDARSVFQHYEVVAACSIEALRLGLKPEAEWKMYRHRIAYAPLDRGDVGYLRRMERQASDHQKNEHGEIWAFNGFDPNIKKRAARRK